MRRFARIRDLVILALGILALCTALNGCAEKRTETTTDATKDRTTVTKETRIREGTDPFKETVYREEVSKETAHSEQSRNVSLDTSGMADFLTGVSTGNPAIDLGLGFLAMFLARKGKDRFTKNKAKETK